MRVSELCHLKLDDVWLGDGMLKALGKGNKERLIPIGKQIQRCLWRYISRFRPSRRLILAPFFLPETAGQ